MSVTTSSTAAAGAAMARGALTWGSAGAGVTALVAALVVASRDGRGPAVGGAVLIGGTLALLVLAAGPWLLGRLVGGSPDALAPVAALGLYGLLLTIVAAAAVWLLRWQELPHGAVGAGVAVGSLTGTVGVVRGFQRSRVLTYGD
ncbi:MAG: hypothetical protein U0Q15_17265 [Kineosporiaceae bacterium]